MNFVGTNTGRLYIADGQMADGGEGSIHRVQDAPRLLLKIVHRELTPREIQKIEFLARLGHPLPFCAMPIEPIRDISTGRVVGFVQPYFAQTVPLSRVLDSKGRRSLRLPQDVAFGVTLCRMLAEVLARLHAVHLVLGDVSDGNFLLARNRLGRVTAVYIIDCNSFQLSIRTNAGTEFFPSGVATEAYAAPEIQPTDWSTSPRTIFTDSFGLAVVCWQLLFNASHPFAVMTPRNVDVPSLGLRIENRLFPFSPCQRLPAGWTAPVLNPTLAILPIEIRELFFRAFSTDDPRDRPTAENWAQAFRSWERLLLPSLPLRIVGVWNRTLSNRLAIALALIKPWAGRALGFLAVVMIAFLVPNLESESQGLLDTSTTPTAQGEQLLRTSRPTSSRTRYIDRDLFPESLELSSPRDKE